MPRKGDNIYKRKDGRWEGRYVKGRQNNRTQYGYVFGKTYSETKQNLEKFKNMVCANPDFNEWKSELFSSVSEDWLQMLKPQLKQASIAKYTNILNSYLLPAFQNCRITEIQRCDVMEFGNRLLETGGVKENGLSPKTVTGILAVLKSIFEYASREDGFYVIDISDISVKQEQKPLRVLSHTEQSKLSQYMFEHLTSCNLGILVCLYTGLRIGEICALKWKDISFSEQYLFVHRAMQRVQIFTEGKTRTEVQISIPKSNCSIRQIPIPNEIFQILINYRKNEDAFLLTGETDYFIEPRTLQNRFKTVMEMCEIRHVNFHALRHTFATRCIELGFDVKSLSEILGHASVNITMNRYVHPSMELKQKNMNMLSVFSHQ